MTHDHTAVADRIASTLRAVHCSSWAVVGATRTEVNGTEFAVTMDDGSRFVVTVRAY